MKQTLTYTTHAGHPQKLDIYLPVQAANQPAPIVVYIHGGGWVQGDKRRAVAIGFKRVVRELQARGFIFASINYRLAPWHRLPDQIADVKCAIRYLRANAAAYNLDPERIGVWGDSAGGHLAAMLGLDCNVANTGDSYVDYSSAVQAVVDMYGPTDLSYLRANPALRWYLYLLFGRRFSDADIRRASPLHYVTPTAPPFLIIHGENDMIVPSRQSLAFYERLCAVGVEAELIKVKYATHALIPMGRFISPGRRELCRRIVTFFTRHLAA